MPVNRKEKRKSLKKLKRKQARKEIAEREREDEERRANDPEEQNRLNEMEEAERLKMERDRKEFEERERKLLEEMERQRQAEEEEAEKRIAQVEEEEEANRRLQAPKNEGGDEDSNWEYVEEGPPEIIWQGNEIIVRKKKVRVPKKHVEVHSKEDATRPTSNPLPPESEASSISAQEMLKNVAQDVPNFGTEQDKAHCPFHLKTGACRFGQRCSRVHFYPDKACTLLIKNMYNGPGLAWEQDEGLEYTDEEVERSYEEFYEDVHTEFLKYGEIVNFKVCRNSSFHLRGNVYVHYKSLDSAVLAYQSFNGRYFAGKQVTCEFVNITRWKVAICGEYMKSRLQNCSRGNACNFIHCFRNPGGDYEWADWDKPPPRFWVEKMTALFGYSEVADSCEQNKEKQGRTSSRTRSCRASSRRSMSRDFEHQIHRYGSRRDRVDYGEEVAWQGRNLDNGKTRSDKEDGRIDRRLDAATSETYEENRKKDKDIISDDERRKGMIRNRKPSRRQRSEEDGHGNGSKDRERKSSHHNSDGTTVCSRRWHGEELIHDSRGLHFDLDGKSEEESRERKALNFNLDGQSETESRERRRGKRWHEEHESDEATSVGTKRLLKHKLERERHPISSRSNQHAYEDRWEP
ncbi:Zinc finger CCCH domain-containing protein 5 [Linum perenne]